MGTTFKSRLIQAPCRLAVRGRKQTCWGRAGRRRVWSAAIRRCLATAFLIAPIVSCSKAEGPKVPVAIPFSFEHNQIVVEAYVNGHGPLRFLFDTATDPSTIDLDAARSAGLSLKATGKAGEGGGSERTLTYDTKFSSLSLGTIVQQDVEAVGMDQHQLHSAFALPVVGVIGYSFIQNRIFTIDYAQHLITFFDHPPGEVTGNKTKSVHLRLDHGDNIPLVEDCMIDHSRVVAAIDTGSSFAITLTPAATTRLGLQAIADAGQIVPGRGYNGVTKATLGKVPVIEIGGVQLRDVEVRFFKPGFGYDHTTWDVNLGNPFLQQFQLTMDYHSRRVFFTNKPTQ